jgi:amino acid transporter
MPDAKKDGKILGTVSVGISAMFTLRTLPCIADSGYQSILFFCVAMLFFFLPISLACAELGSQFPTQGGVYIWISTAFGTRIGFIASWLEWINNALYFITILSLMIVICTHICDHMFHTALSSWNQLLLMLIFFWSATIFNFFPLKYSSLFSSIGTIFGAIIPAIILIVLGGYVFFQSKSHLPMPPVILPNFNLGNAAKLSLAISVFTGIEISSYYIPNIKNPRKTYPRAMLLTAIVMCLSYVLCTLSIASLVPADQLDVTEGSIQAIEFLTNKPLICIIEMLMLIGMASFLNTWVISPLKGLMIASKKGFLPGMLVKNNKNGSPQRLLIVQAVLVSMMVLIFVFVNSNQVAFWFIEIISSQLLMVMYLLVFGACLKLHFNKTAQKHDGYRIPGGRPVFLAIISVGMLSCVISILLALIKPDNLANIHASGQQYALIVIGVTLIMVLPGLLLPARYNPKTVGQENSWSKQCAIFITKRLGWKINNITHPTACKKAIVILAPHTSNWDFFYGMLFKFSYPTIAIKFAIKKEVMFFPLSYLMKALGAIPIDRHKKNYKGSPNMVSAMAEMLNETDDLFLMIAPEGTRSYVNRWKTGFYRLSEATSKPIILGYINYAKKEMGLGPIFYPTGSIEKDMADIQGFYRNIPGKHPEQGVV